MELETLPGGMAKGKREEKFQGPQTNDADDPAYCIRVDDVRGFPGTIVKDLTRADAEEAERLHVAHWWNDEKRESAVVIKAIDDNAMKWLYDWLEDTRQYYKEEYVDASGEHDAARDLANGVYEAMSS